jgi:hypothetical protein
MDSKLWYTSKTLWVNVIALIGTLIISLRGTELPTGWEVYALSAVNIILRFITKKPIVWEK